MGGPSTIKDKIIQLRQLEEAAKVEFDQAKNKLLAIKKQISKLQQLITPRNS